MNFKLFFIFIIFCCETFSSQSMEEYLKANAYSLDMRTPSSNLEQSGIYDYQVYFFGESHDSDSTAYKEIYLLNALKNKVRSIFVESSVSYYYPIQKDMNTPVMDTIIEFSSYIRNEATEYLFKYLYLENLSLSNSKKFKLYPIDMVTLEAFDVDYLLSLYPKKVKPKAIKYGYRILKQIKNDTSISADGLIKKHLLLLDNFNTNSNSYKKYFRNRYSEVKLNMEGMNCNVIMSREDTTVCGCVGNTREDFMLNNILRVVNSDSIVNFISINGSFHIPLTIIKDWPNVINWESLAYRFKKRFVNAKVCSVYFMDKISERRTYSDSTGVLLSKEEIAIFDKFFKSGTYLIRLDGSNTPFEKLAKKFQYIVIW